MGKNNNDIDWGGWVLTLVMLGVFWPVGLVLLFRQLTGYSRHSGSRRPVKRHPYDLERERNAARGVGYWSAENPAWNPVSPAKTGGTGTAGTGTASTAKGNASAGGGSAGWEAVKRTTVPKKTSLETTGRVLTIVGGSIAAVFAIGILAILAESWGSWRALLEDLVPCCGFFGAGLVCVFAGRHRRKKAKRYKKYLAYIGKNTRISVDTLASAMGVRERTVYEDLQEMLDDGILPVGYLDLANGLLVLSDEGLSTPPPPKPEARSVKRDMQDENAILQEIREVNEAIPDAVMSAKIDRIGEITGKILDYQRSHPSKSGQLRSFLNYYLPTTLKILRAYAQLDAQGIEGENITAAKKRIESMMDQVVDGFEKQLDKLFADDALDITSDVQVLENMLRKDGLSGGLSLAQEGGQGTDFSPQQAYLDLQKIADELDAQTGRGGQDDGKITLQL